MFKKNIAIMLSVVIAALNLFSPLSTHGQTTADAQKIRSKVQALSHDKKVEVKLRDTTKVKGFITAVDQDTFVVSNTGGASPETIAYTDVVDIKKSGGGGLSTKTWLIIGGAAAGAIVTWAIVKPAVCDGGAQSRGIC